MQQRRRGNGLEYGVVLLLMEMFNIGISNIPPVTLLAIFGQIALYTGFINPPWGERWEVCISAQHIMKHKEYSRLFLSAIEHGDDMHLYYNMISLIIKGRSTERRMGSKNFALLLIVLTFLTSSIYVGLAWTCATVLESYSYMKTCAIGFSGVLFALKVLTSQEQEATMRLAVWTELIVIYLLVPGSSFMGHFAGILAGLLYTRTWLGSLIRTVMETITGDSTSGSPSFHSSGTSGHYSSERFSSSSRTGFSMPSSGFGSYRRNPPQYGWNVG